ncbi:MAG: MFS transporter [Acidimicrobiales bacterium]|jgi:EmrB/QacA subfamily drug resistance transporter
MPEVAGGLRYRSSTGRWVIAAAVMGSSIAAIDATVVGIALPTIGRDFGVGLPALQWVVTGYYLTLAAFLLLGGSLSDRFGRRRVFSIGVIWFAVASAVCGFAPNVGVLVAMRLLQGIGGALLVPGSLAILQASFAPDDQGQAIGAWSGLGGVATAAGPLLGGYLISAASWRWIFFINIPVAAAALAVTARHVPESKDPAATGHLDLEGATAAVLGLGGLAYALIEGPSLGWSSGTVAGSLVVAVLSLGGFVLIERRAPEPLMPLGMFRRRQFSATNGVTFVVYAALGGALFLLPVELQISSGYSPLESGLALMPVTAIMLALSARSGRLASRIGPRLQMSVGPLVLAISLLSLTRATDGRNYFVFVLPEVVVFALGLAIMVAPLTATAMASAGAEHAGVASAVNNDVARIGGLIAVAVLPAVAGITGRSYLHAAQLSDAFRTAMFVSAAACALGAAVAAFTVTNPPHEQAPGTECHHCGLDGPPLRVRTGAATP